METIINPFSQIDNRLRSIEQKLEDLASKDHPKPEKKFLSVSETAKKLGVAPITVYRGIQAGNIPSKKVGTRQMIPGSYVE